MQHASLRLMWHYLPYYIPRCSVRSSLAHSTNTPWKRPASALPLKGPIWTCPRHYSKFRLAGCKVRGTLVHFVLTHPTAMEQFQGLNVSGVVILLLTWSLFAILSHNKRPKGKIYNDTTGFDWLYTKARKRYIEHGPSLLKAACEQVTRSSEASFQIAWLTPTSLQMHST